MAKTIFTNAIDFQNAVNNANSGAELELSPGSYNQSVQLDYRKAGSIIVHMDGVKIHSDGSDGLYTVDITGENITLKCDELKASGGRTGVLGIRGHNLEILSDLKGYITGNNLGGDLYGTNNFLKGLNFDSLGNVGMSAKGFPLNDNRTYAQKFGWYPSHNWRISQCVFQNIEPVEPGDAGGGFRIIPHAKNVIVDNCLFRNIKGSGLWGDHDQKGIECYYNAFHHIRTAEVSGKALFLEIMDPDPNDTTGFVAKIAGNIFLDCDTQTILIAASSGQNPAGIDVFGNVIDGGWGLVAGAMQRTFKRRWNGKNDPTPEYIVAQLKNIRFKKNVIKQTTGRNHISIFQGRNSGLIEIDNNYYVTGHEYSWTKPNGVVETKVVDGPKIYASESDSESLFIHGLSNAVALDKNAVTGPMPDQFPFPEVFDEIPVPRLPIDVNGLPVIDSGSGGNDGGNTGGNDGNDGGGTTTPPSNDLPDVWIMTDFPNVGTNGELDTDADNIANMAPIFLCEGIHYNILGMTVGCYSTPRQSTVVYKYESPLDAFNDMVRPKVEAEKGPIKFPVLLADSFRKKFDKDIAVENVRPIIQALRDSDKKLYVASGGMLTEAAHLIETIKKQDDSEVLLRRLEIWTHYTHGELDNNRRKDEFAYQYLIGIAGVDVDVVEADKSGAVLIDDKTFPKISDSVLNSQIGSLFHYKWQTNKPDVSDDILLVGISFKELGFDETFHAKLKKDGSSNLQLFIDTFGSQKGSLYNIWEELAQKAANGDFLPDSGSGGNNGGGTSTDAEKIAELEAKVNELSLIVENQAVTIVSLTNQVEAYKQAGNNFVVNLQQVIDSFTSSINDI